MAWIKCHKPEVPGITKTFSDSFVFLSFLQNTVVFTITKMMQLCANNPMSANNLLIKYKFLLTGCPSFETPNNGTIVPSKDLYGFGEVVTVYCRQGFDLVGNERLVCSQNRNWHGQIPRCISKGKICYPTGQFRKSVEISTENFRRGFDFDISTSNNFNEFYCTSK